MRVMSKESLSKWKDKMEQEIKKRVEERFHRNVPGTQWTVIAVQKGLIHTRKNTVGRRRGPEWVSTIRLTWRDDSVPPNVWHEIVPYDRNDYFNNERLADLAHDLCDFSGGPTHTEVFEPFAFIGKTCGKSAQPPRWFAKPASPEEYSEWAEKQNRFSEEKFNYLELQQPPIQNEPRLNIRVRKRAADSNEPKKHWLN